MAKFEEHIQDCIENLGGGESEMVIYREVNARMDQFAHYPDPGCVQRHRQFLHHEEGIRYFGRRYGALGEKVARLHVLKDCGHIPNARQYYNGEVDNFGCRYVVHRRPGGERGLLP